MIADPTRLREVIEEIARWSLQARRSYIGEIQKAFGEAAAEQIKQGLAALWSER
ncbi:DUF7696 family protein [Paraburkholderia gardini]|uniref:DUF7696 family protein n=1 Tax=Paraburkholderia gardini TaxID=2823469 RepID=UPI001E3CB426|nr:hypothetical protein [Paraburkholderia gardini]